MNLKRYELVKLFMVLSCGVSRNVQSFCDQYVKLVDRVVELEKISPGANMASQTEMDKVRGELYVMQYRKLVLESKLVGYHDKVSTPKATVASLELEKVCLVGKIFMPEHGVQKLKGGLNESSL